MSAPLDTYSPQSALPAEGVTATGLFTPFQNIEPDTYNTTTGGSDVPYNQTLIADASGNLVGSENKPYIHMALPTYIPTLYANVYDIQVNLKNIIPTSDMSDNREYPTSYAVKNYVASQLSGTEKLIPSSSTQVVSTGKTTTALVANGENSPNVSTTTDNSSGVVIHTTHFDIDNIDTARNGSSKNIICVTELIKTETIQLNMQIRLDINSKRYFVVSGQLYRSYSFVSLGDSLNMLQLIDEDEDKHLFYVITYGGVFSDKVEITP